MLKMRVINRVVDGVPILVMKATDKASRKIVERIHNEMQVAQWIGISKRMADIHNVCGSSGDMQGVYEICVGLLLGGAEVKKRE
jgi:hypothetical protein